MTLKQKIVGAIVAVLAIFGVSIGINDSKTFGGAVSDANFSTTTDTFAVPTVGTSKLLKSGAGVFNCVTLTNETTGSFNLYDATSSAAHTDYATTSLLKIYASTAEGEYCPEIGFSRGLIVEFQSPSVASGTITWK